MSSFRACCLITMSFCSPKTLTKFYREHQGDVHTHKPQIPEFSRRMTMVCRHMLVPACPFLFFSWGLSLGTSAVTQITVSHSLRQWILSSQAREDNLIIQDEDRKAYVWPCTRGRTWGARGTATKEITDPKPKITYHTVRDFAVEMEEKEIYLVKMLGGDM